MKHRTVVAFLAVGTIASLLSGCGGQTDAPPQATPTTSPTRYESVAALKDAAVAAGHPCPNWKQDNVVDGAKESGTCSDADVFMLFDDPNDLERKATFLTEFGSNFLLGENWLINTKDPAALQAALGGTARTASPTPTPTTAAAEAVPNLTPDDIQLEVFVTEKKCFGSAGCNVSYEIKPTVSSLPTMPIRITYTVEGLEDEQIDSATLTPEGRMNYEPGSGRTKSSKATLTAKVTDVRPA